jgi:hypothetical protein
LRSRFLGVESLFRGCAVRRRKGHKIAVKIQSSHRNAMSREPPAFRSGLTPGFRSRIQNRGTTTGHDYARRVGYCSVAAASESRFSQTGKGGIGHRSVFDAPSSCTVIVLRSLRLWNIAVGRNRFINYSV